MTEVVHVQKLNMGKRVVNPIYSGVLLGWNNPLAERLAGSALRRAPWAR